MSGPHQAIAEAAGMHVLLVEDSPSDRLMAEMALKETGIPHTLHSVEFGGDTLRFLRTENPFSDAPRPDLILLDLNLPGMDGRDLLRRIKADPQLRSIPVIVLTTSAAPSDVRAAYDSHANSYVRKPSDFDQFVALAREVLHFWAHTVIPPLAPDEVVPTQPVPRSSRRILLIEDSPSDALLLTELLRGMEESDAEIFHVDRLAKALRYLESQPFDLIISDLNLPDAKGIEAVHLLKEAAREIPLIVLTGSYADIDDAAISAGADDFLPKSDVTPVRLDRVLRHALRRRVMREEELRTQRLQTIGRLAAGVAHDMNNLLAVIQLSTESMSAINELDRPFVAEILSNVDRGRALTRQLLSVGRKGANARAAVEVNGAIASAASLLARLLDRRVHVVLDLTAESTLILGDLHQLEQVFLNLGINADDAMPDGGTLRISSRLREIARDSGPRQRVVEVTVEDTGVGIPQELMPRLFDPFFTTKASHQGSGLGLSTVREIIIEHGGDIAVANRPDGGAAFMLRLLAADTDGSTASPLPVTFEPMSLEPRAANRTAAVNLSHPSAGTSADTPAAPSVHHNTVRVLIAEDEPAIGAAMQRLLNRIGVTTVLCATADEAWRAWRTEDGRFDALITDIIMPGALTAATLIERLRVERPELPVIVCSGYAETADKEALARFDDITFLRKPFSTDELCSTVAQRVRGWPQPSE